MMPARDQAQGAGLSAASTVNGDAGCVTDAAQRDHELEARVAALAHEVDHRARNTLAVVQSILRLTKSGDMASYADAIEGRIRTLARVQDLLSQSRWRGVDIACLVMAEMAPYRMGEPARVGVAGPSVMLAPHKAQAAALSLHELAANAAKFGALSRPSGLVAIEWRLKDDLLTLDWVESGGPSTLAPVRCGLGSKIIHASIEGQSRGRVAFDWRCEGLHCRIAIPCCGDAAQAKGAVEEIPQGV